MNETIELVNKKISTSEIKRIVLNARGIKYEVPLGILIRMPHSRLGQLNLLLSNNDLINNNYIGAIKSDLSRSLLELCDDFDLGKGEFYFNRDPNVLNLVLNYYTTGKLHIDQNSCVMFINDEMKYWMIEDEIILNNPCCEWHYIDKRDEILKNIQSERELIKQLNHVEQFDNFYCPNLRQKVWSIVEKPTDSFLAKVTF
jgi:potassium voltage-gated channel subfamily F protein 1